MDPALAKEYSICKANFFILASAGRFLKEYYNFIAVALAKEYFPW
jgi:hypothetical protein